MSAMEKVVDNLNRALHALFAEDPKVCLIGEDLLDPYGGAFKVAKGLSTAYPDRVHTTPLSENGFTGFAAGMALAGEKPIVEIMFGDFIAIAVDPIVNFAAKSVTMYGRRIDLTMLVRCPVGGQRAYGPTHSQAMQKYFVGTPNLTQILRDVEMPSLDSYLVYAEEMRSVARVQAFRDFLITKAQRWTF